MGKFHVVKGFRFGMILQLAIGPVCLFIFQTGAQAVFWAAFSGVLGTVLVDGSEIVLAILGVGALLQKSKNARKILQYGGAAVLILFGLSNVLGAFGVDLLPGLALGGSEHVFWQTVLLALSNPLTVLFWAGVFAAKIVEEEMTGEDLYAFGLGCGLATLVFLTLISAVGAFSAVVLPEALIRGLNVAVGCVMIGFGVKNACRR